MIICEHVNAQSVVLLFFQLSRRNQDPDRTDYVRNISGTFQETIVQDMSEEKSTTRQGLICVKILRLCVLPPSPPEK